VKLDIRWPIGLMFGIMGAMLVVWGLVSDPAIYAHIGGLDVNLYWGIALLVFAALMLALAARARRAGRPSAP